MLSYDEKPGSQAIATTAPDLPPKPGEHATVQRDHEYTRLGTVTLSAAVDLVSGFVHHVVTQRHRSREFIAFLERLDARYPAGMLICLLLDNHSAHCSRETKSFLASKPELADRIRRYIDLCNAAPVLPCWRHGITQEPQALAA